MVPFQDPRKAADTREIQVRYCCGNAILTAAPVSPIPVLLYYEIA